MKKIFALAALATVAVTASAQSLVPDNGLSVRVGAFFPTDSNTRSFSRTWFAAGVQYRAQSLSTKLVYTPTLRSSLAFSLDYFQRDDIRVLPLMVNYVGDIDRFFFTVGAGISFTRIPVGGGTNDDARFGYTLGVGYNLPLGTVPVFVEGRFWGNEKSQANGFGFYAGVRF